MCGITGFISFFEHSKFNLHDSLKEIKHRGPDCLNSEYTHFNNSKLNVALGHARLSIIDLASHANQPFNDLNERFSLVFNGEIYNYKILKEELIIAGYKFRTSSDTEVLLAGLIYHGKEWIEKLDGMFAFVFIDKLKETVLIARDRVGIKPLYLQFSNDKSTISFSSEIRGLKPISVDKIEPDRGQIGEFLLNGFLYEPDTGFKNCTKLFPGEILEIHSSNGVLVVNPTRIKEISDFTEKKIGSLFNFRSFFKEEISRQLVSDVPLGVFFSGGIDSTVIATLSPPNTKAIHVRMENAEHGENNTKDDTEYSRKIAKELNLSLLEISTKEPDENNSIHQIDECVFGIEELISDYTFMPTKAISKVARQHGFKVMLSGMGADELFAGYPRHFIAHNLTKLPFKPLFSKAAKLFEAMPSMKRKVHRLQGFLEQENWDMAYTNLVGYFSSIEVSEMLEQNNVDQIFLEKLHKITGTNGLNRAMQLDRYGFLSHNLIVTDKASMSESLEVRVPFLSNNSLSISQILQSNQLISGFKGKLPLRDALKDEIRPSLINRKKVGFNPPMSGLINGIGKNLFSVLVDGLDGIININYIRKLLDEHHAGVRDNTYRIWQLLFLSRWIKCNS